MTIDLNADLGESFGRWTLAEDEALLEIISSANVACGFHAGDPSVMRRTVRRCKARGVAVGAHPGYPDLRGFGRVDLALPPAELENDLLYQLGALAAICRSEGLQFGYVKPHGALYNRLSRDREAAEAVVRALQAFDAQLPLLVPAGLLAEEVARDTGQPYKREAFIDRAYLPSGELQARGEPGSVIHEAGPAAERALRLVLEGVVEAVDGSTLRLEPDSLCIHGDTPGAAALAREVRRQLEEAGITVRAFAGSR